MSATDVTLGAEYRGCVRAGPFRVSIARFPPHFSIPSHFHEWSCVSVLMAGRFEQRFPGRSCDCPPGVVLAKPAGERHEDRWFGAWSRHLIIEIDPDRHEELGPSRAMAEQIVHVPDVGAELIAHSAWQELSEADSVTPLAVEGLVLQLLARAQRRDQAGPLTNAAPPWLDAARDYLHDNYRASIRLAEVAAAAGVHPDYLSRVFGAVYRVTIGEYVRRLRVEAAALRLAASNESISAIAHGTGFSDQSHLTRVFKQRMGVTPGRYRVAHGKPDSAAQGRPDSAAQGRPDSAAQGRRG